MIHNIFSFSLYMHAVSSVRWRNSGSGHNVTGQRRLSSVRLKGEKSREGARAQPFPQSRRPAISYLASSHLSDGLLHNILHSLLHAKGMHVGCKLASGRTAKGGTVQLSWRRFGSGVECILASAACNLSTPVCAVARELTTCPASHWSKDDKQRSDCR